MIIRNGAKKISLQTSFGNLIIIRNGAKKNKSPNFVWGLNKKQQTQYFSWNFVPQMQFGDLLFLHRFFFLLLLLWTCVKIFDLNYIGNCQRDFHKTWHIQTCILNRTGRIFWPKKNRMRMAAIFKLAADKIGRYNVLCIIMLSVNFFCNISSYDILAYHKERGLIVFGCKHRSPQTTPMLEFRALLGSLLSELIEFERWAEIRRLYIAMINSTDKISTRVSCSIVVIFIVFSQVDVIVLWHKLVWLFDVSG
jgi:hypothetical protein